MVMSAEKTVEGYLRELPPERREIISTVRDAINRSMPEGYREVMGFGMICWVIPFSRYPITYNRQPLCFVSLAAQKNHNAVYLMGVYGDTKISRRFVEGFAEAGKKLDMGKSCVRFKRVSDLPLDVIGESISAIPVDDYIAIYERSHPSVRKPSAASVAAAKAKAEERKAEDAAARAASDAAARRKAAATKTTAPGAKRSALGGAQRSNGLGAKRASSKGRGESSSASRSTSAGKSSRQGAKSGSAKRGSARRNAR